jgi:hypothetical protein
MIQAINIEWRDVTRLGDPSRNYIIGEVKALGVHYVGQNAVSFEAALRPDEIEDLQLLVSRVEERSRREIAESLSA